MALFTIRTFKSIGGPASGDEFSNQWDVELTNGDGIESAVLEGFALELVAFERAITNAQVFFSRATISTYAKDSGQGLDTSRTVDISQYGLFPSPNAGSLLPPEVVLVVNLSVGGGRTGKKFIRCAGNNEYVIFSAGKVKPSGPFTDNILVPQLAILEDASVFQSLRVIRETKTNLVIKTVNSVKSGGFSFRQRSRRARPKVPRTEEGLLNALGEAAQLLATVSSGLTVLSVGGNLVKAVLIAAKLAQLKALAQAIVPPALPPAGP